MKSRLWRRRVWRRLAGAVLVLMCAACAYGVMAKARLASPSSRAAKATKLETLLYGRRLLAVGGYELNASFTSDGNFVCFEVSAATPQKCPNDPRA